MALIPKRFTKEERKKAEKENQELKDRLRVIVRSYRCLTMSESYGVPELPDLMAPLLKIEAKFYEGSTKELQALLESYGQPAEAIIDCVDATRGTRQRAAERRSSEKAFRARLVQAVDKLETEPSLHLADSIYCLTEDLLELYARADTDARAEYRKIEDELGLTHEQLEKRAEELIHHPKVMDEACLELAKESIGMSNNGRHAERLELAQSLSEMRVLIRTHHPAYHTNVIEHLQIAPKVYLLPVTEMVRRQGDFAEAVTLYDLDESQTETLIALYQQGAYETLTEAKAATLLL